MSWHSTPYRRKRNILYKSIANVLHVARYLVFYCVSCSVRRGVRVHDIVLSHTSGHLIMVFRVITNVSYTYSGQRVRIVSPFVDAMPWYSNIATFTDTTLCHGAECYVYIPLTDCQITNSLPAHRISIFVDNYIINCNPPSAYMHSYCVG